MRDPGPAMESQLGDFANVDDADAGDLVARLDAMHALDAFRTYKAESFDLLRLRPGARVADVGCGTGDDARQIAERVAPGGTVTGFDLSAEMLAQARSRHAGVPGLTFVQTGSDTLGAEDAVFDAIRTDRVLIHVPDPRRTLAEMIRVVKPGGRVVVSEPDMPGCWVASDNNALADRVMREIAQSCATPYLARDLFAMAKDAGLRDVTLAVRTVTAYDPLSVGKILDVSGVATALVGRGEVPQAEAAAWLEGLMERGRAGRFVTAVNIMIVAGTKS